MNPDESAASLALATKLQEGMMQPAEGQTQENQGGERPLTAEEVGTMIDQKLTQFKDELLKTLEDEQPETEENNNEA